MESTCPRWSLAVLSAGVAAVLAKTAVSLPWSDVSVLAVVTGLVAALHGLTALLALAGLRARARAWRVQSWAPLAWFGWLCWSITGAAIYIGRVYGGLGKGVGILIVACLGLVALVSVPLSVWGLASTGGLKWRAREWGGATLGVLLALSGWGLSWSEAGASPVPVSADLAARLGRLGPAPSTTRAPSLRRGVPVTCERPPGPQAPTALITLAPVRAGVGQSITTRCVQSAEADGLMALLEDATADARPGSTLKIDLVSAVQPLPELSAALGALALRPGLDGVCLGARCLMPWQLVVGDRFNTYTPTQAVPDIRYGIEPAWLRHQLGDDSGTSGLAGLTRVETRSFVVQAGGEVTELRRLHGPRPAVDAQTLHAGRVAAEARVLDASGPGGRFRYLLDPMRGKTSNRNFALPRQAGTTYTLCDVGSDSPEVDAVARASIEMMVALERRLGPDMGGLYYPKGKEPDRIGVRASTLPLVALLACRPRLGAEYDPVIGRLARFVMAMQTEAGGYHPLWGREAGEPIPGPELLYSGGQATFALVLLEDLLRSEPDLEGLPSLEEVTAAVERSMDFYGGPYWDHGARDLLYIEENWHCIAARAALDVHRDDAYERFCIDYVTFKKRLMLSADSGVDGDLVGGHGFGNVLLPHNTGTSGFAEALAASMAVKQARGEPLDEDRVRMEEALGFLLQNQWTEAECFACAHEPKVPGTWSEHMASPVVRIDFIQHAWAGLTHGGRMLGLE